MAASVKGGDTPHGSEKMTNTAKMTIAEKQGEFERQGWRYLAGGDEWTSGVWYHEEIGSVNYGGAYFPSIVIAVEALERFLRNSEFLKQ